MIPVPCLSIKHEGRASGWLGKPSIKTGKKSWEKQLVWLCSKLKNNKKPPKKTNTYGHL